MLRSHAHQCMLLANCSATAQKHRMADWRSQLPSLLITFIQGGKNINNVLFKHLLDHKKNNIHYINCQHFVYGLLPTPIPPSAPPTDPNVDISDSKNSDDSGHFKNGPSQTNR